MKLSTLQKLLRRKRPRILHLDHVEGDGRLLFEKIVAMDLEGIVCKRKDSPYKVTERPSRYWIKVKNSATANQKDVKSRSNECRKEQVPFIGYTSSEPSLDKNTLLQFVAARALRTWSSIRTTGPSNTSAVGICDSHFTLAG